MLRSYIQRVIINNNLPFYNVIPVLTYNIHLFPSINVLKRLMLGRNNERCLVGPCKLGGCRKMEEEQNKLFEVWWQTWLNERVVEYVPQP